MKKTTCNVEAFQIIGEEREEEVKDTASKISTCIKEEKLKNSPAKQRSAMIANKAALFEGSSSSPGKNAKDPALMSVSERKALFEKNKGEALLPKAPFGMAVPSIVQTKKKNKDKVVNFNDFKKGSSNGAISKGTPSKDVVESTGGIASKVAALFKNKTTISQTQIETSIKEQRQKEMDLLLNRFNKNKAKIEVEEDVDSEVDERSETAPMLTKKPPPQVFANVEVANVEVAPPPPPLPKITGEKRKSEEKKQSEIFKNLFDFINEIKTYLFTQTKVVPKIKSTCTFIL